VTGPLFHVKRGDPTPEELAALTAVLAAKARAATAARSRHRPAGPPPWGSPDPSGGAGPHYLPAGPLWGSPAAAHRQPLPPPGPGAWNRAARAEVGQAGGGGVVGAGGPGTGGWGLGGPGNHRRR
jgi:hypothetical protein